MKKIIYNITILALLVGACFSCEPNEGLVYKEKDGLYFLSATKDTDSVYYSFLGKINNVDTLKLPIQILGTPIDQNRTFKVEVDQEKTTAVEGVHYEALKGSYIFNANNFKQNFNLVLYKDDPALETEDKIIALKVVESEDFNPGYSNRTNLKVYVTNRIIKPSYWDTLLYLFFGEYSKVKHNIVINLMGKDFPYTYDEARFGAGWGITYLQIQGRNCAEYFIDNDVDDEDGNKIYAWPVY
ncbi:DUF4843 domain-containing protein [Aestuariibaculum sp. M13]|uniref:DUF4843 domain-containing protein n=1 Tax=Aestuariibaculum sp. M13 TaxID=2967132 RepID=UPI002159C67A|nr:DUF4843 domain-containing protein [Aestuariibaculum sp. M13]MCR8668932.1 DUF4843 domain-containing protein [Aestuariibaculum sp. M13]